MRPSRRILIVLALVLAAGGIFAWRYIEAAPALGEERGWIDRTLAAFGLGGESDRTIFSGYVEAEYVMAASPVGGRLMQLEVARGTQVAAGTKLFALEDVSEQAARAEAEGRLSQAQALLADLLTGKRQPEIDAIVAQRAQAQAALKQSEAEFKRQTELQRAGYVATKAVDDARARRDSDLNRIAELDAQLEVARMPGRDQQIQAAQAEVASASAALERANWTLDQTVVEAPVSGLVVDTLFRPGEMIAPNQPVVQLLPPANLKIRFFVPEALLGSVAVGEKVELHCDGCAAPIPATIRFIAPEAEFTPPVIYSREERTRLVFMAEAWPDSDPEALRVGQPVDVIAARPQ